MFVSKKYLRNKDYRSVNLNSSKEIVRINNKNDKLHNSNAIYVALDYASSSQIGVESLKYKMKGKILNFKLSELLKIENISNTPLLLTQKHDDSDEVFVDAAHLTDFGNMMVSEKIANQILGH